MTLSTAEIRQQFLHFFEQQQHTIVPSSSLVPHDDPTLLFTNAGMVQFKDVFLGRESLGFQRATSSQRCVRAGGKHNDLENVGYTARHHTFFEMLGNFSFGDYFKRDAIRFAWTFLTEVLGFPAEKLWVTVYEKDPDAESIWLNDIGCDPSRFSRIGAKDNFWQMGDTGPCGPCSEIFYDHGEQIAGGPPGTPEEDGDRYIEIWNLVFMQYDRAADGTLTDLPEPSVDTGMGLERLAAILQGVHSNYDIDIFQALIKAAAQATHTQDLQTKSLRVIADHIRSCSFLIADGVLPSNEGRGYVLRRIIRRAIRHGYKLGQQQPFFYTLVQSLIEQMGQAYSELVDQQKHIERVLKQEEQRFAETITQGLGLLQQALDDLSQQKLSTLDGATVFKLYDTYGFPADLTADIAREHDITLDMAAYEQCMEQQRAQARAGSQFAMNEQTPQLDLQTEFVGYDATQASSRVVTILQNNASVAVLDSQQQAMVILDSTPFYAESGGQVGDTGVLSSDAAEFKVENTVKLNDAIVHIGHLVTGSLTTEQVVEAEVDAERRQAIALNHSATHLLHAVLREVLGHHVAQKGSLVDADRLRFDFSHYEAVSPDELAQIEDRVNAQIRANQLGQTQDMTMDEAKQAGAMALFGEKYGDQVRVISFGDYSIELCGGIHAERAGDIGVFKIISESGIASGVRRIEAVTGTRALKWFENIEAQLQQISQTIKATRETVVDKVSQVLERNRSLEKEIERLKQKLSSQSSADLTEQVETIDSVQLLVARLDNTDAKSLRNTLDQLKNKLESAVIVLGTANGQKVSLVAGVSQSLTSQIKAGEVINIVAEKVGGRGGGRPDMAQAGGTQPEHLDDALAQVKPWLQHQLQTVS